MASLLNENMKVLISNSLSLFIPYGIRGAILLAELVSEMFRQFPLFFPPEWLSQNCFIIFHISIKKSFCQVLQKDTLKEHYWSPAGGLSAENRVLSQPLEAAQFGQSQGVGRNEGWSANRCQEPVSFLPLYSLFTGFLCVLCSPTCKLLWEGKMAMGQSRNKLVPLLG